MRFWYALLYCIAWPFFNLVHPCRAIGREHIPEGGALICANHTSLNDPLFLVYALHRKHQVRVMAKAELLAVPVLGWLLGKAGIFGVERGKSDVTAIKTAMKFLKSGEKLLLFPEGTRVKGEDSTSAKTGAAMLAVRTGVPVLPIYIPSKKRWFRRTPVVIGEAFYPDIPDKKATSEEYHAIAEEIMGHIRALKAQVPK